MARPSLPSMADWRRIAETLATATLGAMLLTWLGFPAGLVIGSLMAVATAALIGRPMFVPAALSRAIAILIGISLGALVTPETLRGLAAFPLGVAVLIVSTLVMIGATTSYLRFVHGWDAQSALFGASPGALAQVMMLSAEYKANLRAIAIVQTTRLMALTVGIPAGLAYFGLTAEAGLMTRFAAAPPTSALETLALVGLSTASALLVSWLRLPGGLMFGAMVASALLHGFGIIATSLPGWLVYSAVIGIGAATGARFANTDSRTLLRYLGAAIGSFSVAMTVAALSVLVLTALTPFRVADAVVAFSPGAQDTMMVLALALHLDPVFVAAMHLSRFMLVSMLVPYVARKLRHGPKRPRHQGRPGPNGIED